ncbi:hypothetical protein H8959_004374 [Pygathrix nigripes]
MGVLKEPGCLAVGHLPTDGKLAATVFSHVAGGAVQGLQDLSTFLSSQGDPIADFSGLWGTHARLRGTLGHLLVALRHLQEALAGLRGASDGGLACGAALSLPGAPGPADAGTHAQLGDPPAPSRSALRDAEELLPGARGRPEPCRACSAARRAAAAGGDRLVAFAAAGLGPHRRAQLLLSAAAGAAAAGAAAELAPGGGCALAPAGARHGGAGARHGGATTPGALVPPHPPAARGQGAEVREVRDETEGPDAFPALCGPHPGRPHPDAEAAAATCGAAAFPPGLAHTPTPAAPAAPAARPAALLSARGRGP